jgi:hypothetical protein
MQLNYLIGVVPAGSAITLMTAMGNPAWRAILS